MPQQLQSYILGFEFSPILKACQFYHKVQSCQWLACLILFMLKLWENKFIWKFPVLSFIPYTHTNTARPIRLVSINYCHEAPNENTAANTPLSFAATGDMQTETLTPISAEECAAPIEKPKGGINDTATCLAIISSIENTLKYYPNGLLAIVGTRFTM